MKGEIFLELGKYIAVVILVLGIVRQWFNGKIPKPVETEFKHYNCRMKKVEEACTQTKDDTGKIKVEMATIKANLDNSIERLNGIATRLEKFTGRVFIEDRREKEESQS